MRTISCKHCGEIINEAHGNRKYCTKTCENKARYARTGQRITKERRKELYRQRCKQPGYRKKLRLQENTRHKKVRDFLREYKTIVGCLNCGYSSSHAALEFHHVSGEKEINVCNAKSITRAKREIKKCVVLCANCHRNTTFEEYGK